ncbi:MAG: type II toxin-antitoxin system RelE/ParE family toxin [Colwellia sp.]|jgi:Uncharacterized protein conserved in bacteria
MLIEVLLTDTFTSWFKKQPSQARADILASIEALEEAGPLKGRPLVDKVKHSDYKNMKELRVSSQGQPIRVYRIYFAFDPQQRAVMLIGGNKVGNNRFYKQMTPKADRLYKEYLGSL